MIAVFRALSLLGALGTTFVLGCDDAAQKKAAAKQQLEQQQYERHTQLRKAAETAEQTALEDPRTGTQLINILVSEWLSQAPGGLILVDGQAEIRRLRKQMGEEAIENKIEIFVLPVSTEWLVECNSRELKITLGSWLTDYEDGPEPILTYIVMRKLSPENCKIYSLVVAEKMRELMR